MYVRLAFAVAAHLETEILFVDEVLSVGDMAFQKKCLGKMDEVAHQGRTVVFVSHNINAVATLCRSAMLLVNGELAFASRNVSEVLRRYTSPAVAAKTVDLSRHPNRISGAGVFEEIALADENEGPTHCFRSGSRIVIDIKVRPPGPVRSPRVSIGFTNARGERAFAIGTHIGGTPIPSINGPATIRIRFIVPPLIPGEYTLDIGFYDWMVTPLDEIIGAAVIEILKDDYLPGLDGESPHVGHIVVRSEWGCVGGSPGAAS
jgi:lipopolysaccharide transport system ATP-binding protein